MYSINQDIATGFITISDTYIDNQPQFKKSGDTYAMSFINLKDVQKFKSFTYSTTGSIETRYLTTSYRVSRDANRWTPWMELDTNITNFPIVDVKDPMFIDIKWERVGSSNIGIIKLNNYSLQGTIQRNLVDGTSTTNLSSSTNEVIIKPPYVYKVFKITDLEILSDGDINGVDIKYRFSQDYGRTVTDWEPLTKENITTVRINPIRFFQIEYLLKYTGSSSAKIYDINLIGDFQNVTLDSQKTNLYGSREDCNCLALGIISGDQSNSGVKNTDSANTGIITSQSCDPNVLQPLTSDDISKLFQPYQQTQAINLLNKFSTDANQVFGHEVVYFLTDPDKKGTDFTFHEYQLYNYVCSDLIKVSVDGNNFPDNQIVMNQFDLSLFESFEIHIPKDTFKTAFGVEKRPSKEDFLWFCEINRMFQVEHAQQFRNFNNSALYYKVMLKKYVQKSNIIGVNQTITDKVKELTKNSTIDELFGLENSLDKKQVANEEQTRTLTQDVLRVVINANIDKELIENSTTIISKSNYDLSSVDYQTPAVVYRNFRNHFKVSDNFSFMIWFSINNYTVNDLYNFINYYDETNQLGFKINLQSDNIIFNLNSDEYRFKIGCSGEADALQENTWYSYLVNVNQRKRTITQYIYKRNVEFETDAGLLNSTVLQKVYVQQDTLNPVDFEIEDVQITVFGSDMKATNIRLFNDVIPEEEQNKILNQIIIGRDYRYLIFADNANMRLVLPNLPFNQVDTNIVRGEVNKINLNPPNFPESDI
jgi:hypothetical protein